MFTFSRKFLFSALIFTLLVAIALGGGWYWLHRGPQLDGLIREAFSNANKTSAYAQVVETEIVIEERHIRVVGEYFLDDVNKRFSSRATTTLTLPDGTSHTFSLNTITINEDMYTQVESQSPSLNLSVRSSQEWKHFTITSIPPEYREIATPRPPIDNLTLFRDDGAFLTLREGRKNETSDNGQLAHYVFGLSPVAFTEKSGPVSMIAERVGVHGTVEVWVRESDAHILSMRLSNEPYVSNTTFKYSGNLPLITPPDGSR